MKKRTLIILILIFALFIRSFGLDLLLLDDEAITPMLIERLVTYKNHEDIDYTPYGFHPPGIVLSSYLNYKSYEIFLNWFHIKIPIRWLSLVLGMLTIVLTYFLSKLIYDDITALVVALIMSLSFYHIWASLQIETNGSLLTLFLTATFYTYYKSLQDKKLKMLWYTGILLGVSLLIRYEAIFVIPTIFLFELFCTDSKNMGKILFISVVGVSIFSLFPIFTFLIGRFDIFKTTISWGANVATGRNIVITPTFFIKIIFKHLYRLIQYGTPLLVFIPLFVFINRQSKKEYLLFLWIGVYMLFFIIVIKGHSPARFQMEIIPPLCILTAKGILDIFKKSSKSHREVTAFSLFLFFSIVFGLSSFRLTQIPFTFEHFDAGLLSKNPSVWYQSTSGPLFAVSLYSLLFVVILSILLFISIITSKNYESKAILLILFITLNLAFNTLLVEELLFSKISPNYNIVMNDMIQFHEENSLPEPLYSINEDFGYYINHMPFLYEEREYPLNGYVYSARNKNNIYKKYYDLDHSKGRETLGKEGGTVMWLNLPPPISGTYTERILLRKVKDNCTLKRTFYSKDFEAGFIYICNKNIQ